jgi:LEA14-like dessication related protein
MRHLKIYYLFALSFILISCGKFSEITVGEINGVTIKGFEENAMIIALSIPVNNPTHHKITLSDFNTKVTMNNQYLGKVNSSDPVILMANSQQVYDLVLEVRLANVFGTALTLMNMKKGQRVLFRIEGSMNARTFLVKKKLEINESREVTF